VSDAKDDTKRECYACGCKGCAFCGGSGYMTVEQAMRWREARMDMSRTNSQSFSAHRAVILAQLSQAWDSAPDLALGELLVEAFESSHMTLGQMRGVTNVRLIEIVKKYAMTRVQ